jgi:glycosyltransferase involved in cell wall biosynthesis
MTRVLFVYCFCTVGGVETGLRFRMEALPDNGIEAHVLFLRDEGGRSTFRDQEGRVFFTSREDDVIALIRQGGYDLISIIDAFEVLPWVANANFTGRLVLELQSTYEDTLARVKKIKADAIDAIFVPSAFQATHVQPFLPAALRGKAPVFVVPNFVDLTRFETDVETVASTGRKVVCWVGRIDPLKNWSGFLAVAERLADREDIEFWMVGGGRSALDARAEFRRALGESRIAARLRWWPTVPFAAMPRLYRAVRASGGLLLLTTRNESFGFVALEAMASGCPVVVPRVGALPEIVEDGVTGVLYELGDAASAAACAADILDDRNEWNRLSEVSSETVRNRFSLDRCGTVLADAITQVLREVR